MTNLNANQFEAHRPLMFSIAYRMLGSATEAEDIVQEAYLRYQGTIEPIEAPKAFLSTIVTRLCLNQLQSASSQRTSYIGPWLPEPILTEADALSVPVHQAELHESLSLAFLTLLEQLTPLERAVFLLREVFDYEYADIAGIVGKEEAACRQMFSRAKKHITEQRPRFKPTPEAHRHLLDTFIQAANTGEMDALMQVLAEDVTLWADGGGKARGAAIRPLHGREAVAHFVLATSRFRSADYHMEYSEVNGELAVILREGNQALVVLAVTGANGFVTEIRAIGNPDKLKWVSTPSDTPPDSSETHEAST
ncbi:MAG: RNA polymerase sigma-70 factor [Anaerolineae bacterium]|nr:RNA polymerase sigma-70 factor [Anaerolineae bacterium]